MDSVREEIEPAKLFFADFAMLEVDEDAVSVGKRRRSGMTMDSFRKEWLVNPKKAEKESGEGVNGEASSGVVGGAPGGRPSARWRRCARGAVAEEAVLVEVDDRGYW